MGSEESMFSLERFLRKTKSASMSQVAESVALGLFDAAARTTQEQQLLTPIVAIMTSTKFQQE
jgi:hypothetical protein